MKTENSAAATAAVPDRGAHDFAARAHVERIVPGRTELARLEDAHAEFLNSQGKKLGEAQLQTESRPEDVVGVVAFSNENRRLKVYSTECLRVALGARALVGLPPLGDESGGRVINEIGTYLGNVDGISEAALNALQSKSRLKPVGPLEFLGYVVTPNASVSGELAVPVAQRVEPPSEKEILIGGEGFDASRVVISMTPQEVVQRFFSGQLSDLRFFDNVLELHAALLADGRCIDSVSAPANLTGLVKARLSNLREEAPANLPILENADAVRAFQEQPSQNEQVVAAARVSFDKIPAAQNTGLFKSYILSIQNQNSAGAPVGKNYNAEAIVRSHDALHLIVLTKQGLMPVNIGARAALEIRDRSPHVIHTQTRARNIENPWGSLEGPYQDEQGVIAQIKDIVRARTGHELSGEPILTDMQGYNSPGFNTSGVRFAICFIDLDQDSAAKLPADTKFVRPDTLIEAQVRDLPLRVVARVASLVTGVGVKTHPRILTPEERQGFHKLVLGSNEFDAFVRKFWPQQRELMQKKPILDSISNCLVRRDGWEIEQPNLHDPEKYFFNALMQGFAVHPGDNPLRVVQLIWHDFWHYRHPDPIPFERGDDGELKRVTFEIYAEAVMRNEIDAVMFSDVILPESYGVEKFEMDSGARSLAGLLGNSGIKELEDQRAAIALSLKTGKLDPRNTQFLKTSGRLAEYEPVIREKLLGYYVRDTLKNVQVQYDSWIAMPQVAKVATQLGVKFPSQIQERSFSDGLDRLTIDEQGRPIATGRNNLSQELGKIKTYAVYRDALRLAYLANALEISGANEQIEDIRSMIDRLVGAHSQLESTVAEITSIEENPTNARAYRLIEQVKAGVARESEALVRFLVSESGPFDEARRKQISARIQHLPFPLLSFDPREDEEAQAQVSKLISAALN